MTQVIPLPRYQKPNYRNLDGPVECEVAGTISLVLRVSRCAGVAPLSISDARAGWRIAVSPPLAVFQRFFMTFLNVVALAAMVLDIARDPSDRIRVGATGLTAFVWISDLAMVMIIASLSVYPGSSRMEDLIRVLKKLQQIRVDLHADPSPRNEKIRSIAVACLLIFTVVIQVMHMHSHLILFVGNEDQWPMRIMAMYTVYHAAYVLGLLALLECGCTAMAIRSVSATINTRLQQLRHVNLAEENTTLSGDLLSSPAEVDCFTEQNEVPNSEYEFTAHPSHVLALVRRLARAHELVGEVIKKMNATHGALLVMALMCNFLHLVVTPYYSLKEVERIVDTRGHLLYTMLQLCWSVLHFSTLLITVEPCHRAQEQREITKFLLSKLMVYLAPKCERLSVELERFAKQILLTKVEFTPLGLLTLARPLMATILGGVATYLVIIIQFQTFSESY